MASNDIVTRQDLDRRLHSWVGAGLISMDQADTIRRHEQPEATVAPDGRQDWHPLMAEAIGYVGVLLVVVAGGLVLGKYWTDLEPWARLTAAAGLTGFLVIMGAMIRNHADPAVRRLASTMWLLSSGGVAWVTGILATEVFEITEEPVVAAVGLTVTVYSWVLWRIRSTALQQLALLAGTAVSIVGLLLLPEPAPEPFFVAFALWGLGLVWLRLGWSESLAPHQTAIVSGAALAAFAFWAGAWDDHRGAGLVLAMATAGGLIAVSVQRAHRGLLGIGLAASLLFVPQFISHFFGDTIGGTTVFLFLGIVLVGWAVRLVRRHDRLTRAGR